MTQRIARGGLSIAKVLDDLIKDEVAPGTGVTPEAFWSGFERIVAELGPRNRALLEKRDAIQARP